MQVQPLRERLQQQTLLEISVVAVSLFAERGFAETTVEEIARAAGTSVRTFHRYFPAKEDAVSPALDAGWQLFVDAFAARPADEPVPDGLVAALAESLHGEMARRHLTLIQTLPGSPALEPAWLRVHARCQAALEPVLAGARPGARLAAGALRRGLRRGRDQDRRRDLGRRPRQVNH